jgi:O-antigen ligase
MSVGPSQADMFSSRRRAAGILASRFLTRRFDRRSTLGLTFLLLVLIAQGVAVAQSDLWAVPLLCLLLVAVAPDLPLIPLLGLLLLVRVLTDDLASSNSRHSSSVNLSAAIAGLYILVAIGLLLHRHRASRQVILATLWLCVWTAIAAKTNGASTLTVREGVREASIVALAVIVFNSRGVLNISLVTRMVQMVGVAAAVVALYQLATHGGQSVGGEMRANGTFSQPNSAAVFFAVATMVSVWRFIDRGRQRSDAIFTTLYAVATISTFSLGGLACLLVMLVTFGLLRPGSARLKLGSCAVAALIIAVFLATPLGAERVASESSTNLTTSGQHGESGTSLGWRFFKWGTLIPEWEQSPIFGRGLGTTITSEGNANIQVTGVPPHNEPLRYLVETGIFGLLTLFAAVIFLLRRLARLRRIPGAHETATLGIAVVVGMLINGVGANTLLYTPAAYVAAMVVAAVLGAGQDPSSPTLEYTQPLRPTNPRLDAAIDT